MKTLNITIEDIKRNLCINDPENPNNNLDCYDVDEDFPAPEPRVNCGCDNCFYGRDKLARYILSGTTMKQTTNLPRP
jgi:hypothetical protein